MFSKVLVANRGEIAIRIMRACKELKIDSVAVYSEADKYALFTRFADEAYCIGKSSPSQSYLNIDNIMEVAEETGVDAIHPGYGFLAENPKLGKECEKRGIKIVGPSGDVIESMGDKITAKRIMREAGVPVIPGTDKGITSVEEGIEIAESIGYPVIVKASAGGGGIGMATVYSREELVQAIESTQSIAGSAFGDSTVFIEKYLEEPRHIEFQVMGDEHGNIIHVADRECSIQRRHQKLIEESPSPIMTELLRDKMGNAAVKAAEYINYTNAGTVEFLYANGEFYFLEMNTRIQVEHPITEMVTGVDLVQEQLKVAAGQELSYKQDEINVLGHAIECRINAEDPLANFTPNPGKITSYRSPGGFGIRVDSGIYNNYSIPQFYDSMISKLIAYDRTREAAINRMERALQEYIIIGVKTTLPFHKAMMRNKNFRAAKLHTHFIDEHANDVREEMLKVVAEDKEMLDRLKSTFLPGKKVAAITAAVGSYMQTVQRQKD